MRGGRTAIKIFSIWKLQNEIRVWRLPFDASWIRLCRSCGFHLKQCQWSAGTKSFGTIEELSEGFTYLDFSPNRSSIAKDSQYVGNQTVKFIKQALALVSLIGLR